MAKAAKSLKPIADANGKLLKAGQSVQLAPDVPADARLAGRTGVIEYIEEGYADRGMVDVQFPAAPGLEPAFTQFTAEDLVQVAKTDKSSLSGEEVAHV